MKHRQKRKAPPKRIRLPGWKARYAAMEAAMQNRIDQCNKETEFWRRKAATLEGAAAQVGTMMQDIANLRASVERIQTWIDMRGVQ